MVGGGRFIAATVAAAVVVLALGACAGDTTQSTGDSAVTLAQSKSYAQLLRNEASSRLPEIVLKQVAESSDVSVACDETDPAGLSRSWSSSMSILVTNSTAARIQKVADDLAASFVEQGWKAKQADDSTETLGVTTLRSATSLADIAITATSKDGDQLPSIQITATGVCALTDGPESDEVTMLEQQDAANAG